MGKRSGKDRASGRTADRLAGVGILITDSPLSQSVQIGGFHNFVAVAAQHVFSCGVRHNKNDLSFHVVYLRKCLFLFYFYGKYDML